MKRFIIGALFCVLLLTVDIQIVCAKPVKDSVVTHKKFGIGLSFNPVILLKPDTEGIHLPTSQINVHLPILINNAFRFEPEIGFYSGSFDSDEPYPTSLSYYRFGIGGFYSLFRANNISMYIGPRIGVLYSNFKSKILRITNGEIYDQPTSVDENAWMFGASFGGEYMFTNYLSLGVELQLSYYYFDEIGKHKSDWFDKSVVKTNGLLFIRFYLF